MGTAHHSRDTATGFAPVATRLHSGCSSMEGHTSLSTALVSMCHCLARIVSLFLPHHFTEHFHRYTYIHCSFLQQKSDSFNNLFLLVILNPRINTIIGSRVSLCCCVNSVEYNQ